MRLDGWWRATTATDDLRRDGIGVDVDDGDWPELRVPGHWRSHDDFADSDGPLMYRHRYRLGAPADGQRRWITFDGIFYQADIWLDGAYLGDPEGYFFAHSYDITALSRIGDEHVVAAEVTCSPQPDYRAQRNITGGFQNGPAIDPAWNPGGIWRSVRIYDTGPVKFYRFRVLCRDANPTRAHLLLAARLDSDTARSIGIRTYVDGALIDETDRQVAGGVNDVRWSIDIADPALWWPRSIGDQPLVDITAEIIVEGSLSDHRTRRTGLREVAWNDWTCSVNGERLFLKGANLMPAMAAIADASALECRRDIELAAEAGLDMVRVHSHIAPDAIYQAADELGVLICQDFPLQGGYQRSVRAQAIEQAGIAIDELGHHPSIVQWSAHHDPTAHTHDPTTASSKLRYIAGHQIPTWNKSVLDRWVKRAIERADPTRLVSPHSGILPHLPLIDGTDSHLYFGWYHGEVDDLDRVAARAPRVIRFVSEFGAQSVPNNAEFIDDMPGDRTWPDLDWATLAEHHGLERSVFDERVPPERFESFEAWRRASQAYQAELVKHHIELLRRHKYRPTGGFAVFALNDAAPMVSCSLLDHRRSPKLAYETVRDACQQTIVVLERPPAVVTVGDTLELPVYVINDRRASIDDAIVDITASWPAGERRWRFGGTIGADAVHDIALLELPVPETLGVLEIQLELTWTDGFVTNQYRSAITNRPGS